MKGTMSTGRQVLLAKALYDNVAESPDELAFRRGDVLTVVERDTAGLEGWWLCALRGRQGIAPGNRLKLLSGMEPAPQALPPSPQPRAELHAQGQQQQRGSWEASPGRVVTPRRLGDTYIYDEPNRSMQDYDVPPPRHTSASPLSEVPGAPGQRQSGSDVYDSPASSRSSSKHSSLAELNGERLSRSSSKHSSVASLEAGRCSQPSSCHSSMDLDSLASRLDDLGQAVYDTPQSNRPVPPPPAGRPSPNSNSHSGRPTPNPPSSRPTPNPPSSSRPIPNAHPNPPSEPVRTSGNPTLPSDPTYDVPASHSRQSSEGLEIYDVPPSHSRQNSQGLETYDVPPSHGRQSSEGLEIYDVPPSHGRQSSEGLEAYDVPPANRSSVLSTASNESGHTASSSTSFPRTSNPASVCDSARSSLDVSPHDLYDIPSTRGERALKQLSADSGLDVYDTPPRPRPASPGGLLDGGPPPRLTQSKSADLSSSREGGMAKRGSLEHALDDIYDVPRSNAPALSSSVSMDPSFLGVSNPPGVYDVPPQVTRDSVISARSDSSEEGQRLSSCSTGSDVPSYHQLPLELDAALESLTKLQQDVAKANSRFLSFVSSTWRKKENLETKMYSIKGACATVRQALAEFVTFAQGALANSTQLADRKLVNRLCRQLTPLQSTLQALTTSLAGLEEMKWQVTLLAEPLDSGQADHLGQFALASKDMTTDVKRLASLIQGNATLLFRRAPDFHQLKQERSSPSGRPPLQGKSASLPARSLALQQRPLPPPPPSDRPLPLTPLEQLQEADRSSSERDQDPVYVNPAEMRGGEPGKSGGGQPGKGEGGEPEGEAGEWSQEYDYVHLEAGDLQAQKQRQAQLASQRQLQNTSQEELKAPELLKEGAEVIGSQLAVETGSGKRASWREELEEPCRDPGPGLVGDPPPTQRPSQPTDGVDSDLDYVEGPSDPAHLPHDPVDKLSAQCERALDHVDMVTSAELLEELCDPDLQTPVNKEAFNLPETGPGLEGEGEGVMHLESSDKQVLVFYSGQLDTHATLLTNAVEAFFNCVEANQPPKDFISHSKFVVVSAHKLVHIGDSLHRALAHEAVRLRIMHSANELCERLKHSVVATKTAALQYPSVPALQDMVDRVVDVSHAASALRRLILQCAAL